ncbi:DUF2157 domain-containing protein [Candidatus Methylospira mobilis]|uniref:DUF2157 domain-containing protein n=1 Tax=Candidatus Methylospira mobilis TaxID=1808979 RepID=A0A5Q0BQE9_9GAMM|nr:DUF2157 domain-containing protein [Candidatus Methylospira mobilis]QFY44307.1 DUF2157 domain-containing protein [Candidatus Methylospira mobilis]
MELFRSDLKQAAERGLISTQQAERLWEFLQARAQDTPGFNFTHVLYYLGGLIAIGAMSLFMTLGWESFGGWGLLSIALAYAAAGLALTEFFLKRKRLPIPAGITATFVVVLTPLAVYGLQHALGWWADGRVFREYNTHIDWRWVFMELATLASGILMLWRYRLPFLMMPIAVTLWYMSMDFTPLLFGEDDPDWKLRQWVSLWFGLGMLLLSFWVDIRNRSGKDYAFWLYLFGVIAFWGGLSLMDSDSERNKFIYLCINLLMIGVGAMISRRVFAVFGGLGATGYFGHLAYDVFKDSLMFPFALTLIGLAIIYLGIVWQRHEQAISKRLRELLPLPLQCRLLRQAQSE